MPGIVDSLRLILGDQLLLDEPMANHSTFHIGGPARYFCPVVDDKQLMAVLILAKKENIPYTVIGGGSNILVSDQGFAGIVIKIAFDRLRIKDGNIIDCDAGVDLGRLVGKSVASGLTGLEWAVGIPGSVGGAIYGNAGAYRGEMKDSIIAVRVLRAGKIKVVKNKQCGFTYRDSWFKSNPGDIILSATFQLAPGDQAESRAKMKTILKEREAKFGDCISAGSVFKNIILTAEEMAEFVARHPELPEQFATYRKVPAAWLIDQCDFKSVTVGGAGVYDRHAGIITNLGGATAEDVVILISRIKQKVRVNFNIQLLEEVQYIGF